MEKNYSFLFAQFHEIPENDIWWGKGFTEWVRTKKAKPLFIGHNQPRIPYKYNYYNLLSKRGAYWLTAKNQRFRIPSSDQEDALKKCNMDS